MNDTDIRFQAQLDPKAPQWLFDFLVPLAAGTPSDLLAKGELMPDHELFETKEWRSIFNRRDNKAVLEMEYEEVDGIPSKLLGVHLLIDTSVGNSENEIRKFMKWIAPHVLAPEPVWVGYDKYGLTEIPTLHFMCQGQHNTFFPDETLRMAGLQTPDQETLTDAGIYVVNSHKATLRTAYFVDVEKNKQGMPDLVYSAEKLVLAPGETKGERENVVVRLAA